MEATYTFGKDGNKETIECKNTYKLQLTSIGIFAAQLGYVFDNYDGCDGGSFIYAGDLKHGKDFVRFNTMRKWHDTNFMFSRGYFHKLDQELPKAAKELGFDVESMQNAIDSKLVKRVYLQSNKDKVLTVQKHLVEFA